MLRRLLQSVHDGEHGDERQGGARQVDPAGVRVAVLGQEERSEDQEERHHRERQEEDRAPPEELEQRAAEERSQGAAERVGGDPDPDRERALARILEQVSDQGERRGCDRRARDAEQRSRCDEHLGARGEGGEERGEREPRCAEQEQAPAPDPVTQRAHRDQETGDHEAVDVRDPEELVARRLQVFAEVRHREVQNREIHRVDDARDGKDGEADPLAAARLRGRDCAHGHKDSPATRDSSPAPPLDFEAGGVIFGR